LDALDGRTLRCPRTTTVMQTGGTKGRKLRSTAPDIAQGVARALGIGVERVVSEYGMTELGSQAYSDNLRTGTNTTAFTPSPCLRITPVDPVRLRPVPDGEPGLARFVDLCNVDSAVCVLTQDLVVRTDQGVELLGRRPGAPARGCSLDLEDLILHRSAPQS
ncbi:MAG TPA: acyl-protein synthetase, partial [Polyangiaceae bacterium]|nr:acyl-protein synthetase [Polyangiaceae bacterium]